MKEDHRPIKDHPLEPRKLIRPDQFEPLLSSYLLRDYKDEEWVIQSFEQEGNEFFAVVDLLNIKPSLTDPNGFHLSISSAGRISALLEMAGALILLDQTEKTVEMWALENRHKCLSAIRSNIGITLCITFDWRLTSDGSRYLFKSYAVIRGKYGGSFTREVTYIAPKPLD